MKKLIIVIIIIISFQTTRAQNITYGVKGGANFASFNENFESPFDYKYKLGFQIGGLVKIKLTERLYLQPELLYSLQGTSFDLNVFNVLLPQTSPNDPSFIYEGASGSQNESNIILPVMFKYYVSDNFNIEFGPQLDFLFNTKSDILLISTEGVIAVENESINGSEFNFGMNLGIGYDFNEKMGLGLRYNYGLNRLFEGDLSGFNNDFKLRNSIFSLNLEYRFN